MKAIAAVLEMFDLEYEILGKDIQIINKKKDIYGLIKDGMLFTTDRDKEYSYYFSNNQELIKGLILGGYPLRDEVYLGIGIKDKSISLKNVEKVFWLSGLGDVRFKGKNTWVDVKTSSSSNKSFKVHKEIFIDETTGRSASNLDELLPLLIDTNN